MTSQEEENLRLLLDSIKEFRSLGIGYKMVHHPDGNGLEFQINGFNYTYYPSQLRLIDHQREGVVIIIRINKVTSIVNWIWEQQYQALAKKDELFAEFVRYHAKQNGVMHQLRHPGTGEMKDYFAAVPRKVFEYALKDTQMTKLLRAAEAQVENLT